MTAIGEAAKIAASTLVAYAGGGVVAGIAGEVSKQFVQTMLEKTSLLEEKIDRLLFEPLHSGVRLLYEASIHLQTNEKETASRDALLDDCHLCFVRARKLVGDCYEDIALIGVLDCLALTWRTGRESVAVNELAEVARQINTLRRTVEAYKLLQRFDKARKRGPTAWEEHRKKEVEDARAQFESLENLFVLAFESLSKDGRTRLKDMAD